MLLIVIFKSYLLIIYSVLSLYPFFSFFFYFPNFFFLVFFVKIFFFFFFLNLYIFYFFSYFSTTFDYFIINSFNICRSFLSSLCFHFLSIRIFNMSIS